jgi:hypothetical protein
MLGDKLAFPLLPPKSFLKMEPREDFFRCGLAELEPEGLLNIDVRTALGWVVGGGSSSCDD